ncbi:MAG: hypothetical protein KJO54_07745 [Gammaproteobacteria bacterium]|nr:hypothetical protein [Gammaproteobacteria bacterium]NNF62450.1 hypothetical protein [Gammaproteobacteria bacterium]NNM21802.1 hypothetical protein [Gammaproteobacteria bacterium]
MAVFSPDWRALTAALLLLNAQTAAQEIPILLDAATTDFDRGNQRLIFEEVSIRRGNLGIAADNANTSQLDFANSTWVFSGDVKIFGQGAEVTAERAEMKFADHRLQRATITGTPAVLSLDNEATVRVDASEAVVTFADDDLSSVTLSGTPARFEHSIVNPATTITRGSAGRLIYNLDAATITLANDAWVSQGENEIRGEEITYDIVAQRIVAGGEDQGDRVRITITPPADASLPEAEVEAIEIDK